MMSTIPTTNIGGNDINKQILRTGIISELDAISLYEQMALVATNEDVKKVLLDIANEEKIHVGEFEKLLSELDKEQEESSKDGEKEVEEMTEAKQKLYGKSSNQKLNEMYDIFKKINK